MKSIRNYLGLLILFCIALLNFSCKPRELPKEKEVVTITKTLTELKRDTIIKVEADSTFYEALIKCQNGKPVLSSINNYGPKSTNSKTGFSKNLQNPKVTLSENGKLNIRCDYFENLYKIALKDKYILEQRLNEKTIIPEPKLIEKPLSWWQKTWIFLGRFFTTIALIYLILFKIPWKASLRQ